MRQDLGAQLLELFLKSKGIRNVIIVWLWMNALFVLAMHLKREVKMEFLELFVLGIDIAAIILIGIVVYVFYFM